MGALNCGSTMVKYLLFFFNFVIALGGLALAILGGIALYNLKHLKDVPASLGTYAPILLAAGVIIFVIAFYGCCGAVRESNCMLVTFAVLLLTLIVLEVAGATYIIMNKDSDKEIFQKYIATTFRQAETDQFAAGIRDGIQSVFHCCGESGPPLINVPRSCCKPDVPACTYPYAYSSGCSKAVPEYIIKNFEYLAYVAVGIAAVELLEVCFALGLASAIRSADRRY